MTACLLPFLLNTFTSVTVQSHEETETESLFAASVFCSFLIAFVCAKSD